MRVRPPLVIWSWGLPVSRRALTLTPLPSQGQASPAGRGDQSEITRKSPEEANKHPEHSTQLDRDFLFFLQLDHPGPLAQLLVEAAFTIAEVALAEVAEVGLDLLPA